MIRCIIILTFIVTSFNAAYTQLTYNNRLSLGYAATIFTGLEMTDSCTYLTGMIADTLPPSYPLGIFFAKVNSDGSVSELKPFFMGSRVDNFHCNFSKREGGFISSGLLVDTAAYTAMYMYDQMGNIEQVVTEESLEGFSLPLVRGGTAVGNNNHILLANDERNSWGTNNDDSILRYYDAQGTLLWRKNYGNIHGNMRDYPVDATISGEYFIIGSWLTNGNKVWKNFTTRNYIFAVDTLGEVQWQYYSPSTILMRAPRALYAEEDGGIIVSTFLGEEFEINDSHSGIEWHTAYIYKLQPPNEIVWSTTFEQPHPTIGTLNNFHKIVKAPDNSGYVLAGHIAQLDEEEGADIRGWLIKISQEGDSLWSRRLRYLEPNPNNDYHEFYDLETTPDGGYLMAGQVNWYNGPPPIQQGWLMKVDEWGCLVPGCHLLNTIEPIDDIRLSLSIFPNPATEVVNVLLKDEGIARRQNAELRLVDASGQVLQHHPAGRLDEVTNVLSVYNLPAGIYWLQYVADGNVLALEQFMKS